MVTRNIDCKEFRQIFTGCNMCLTADTKKPCLIGHGFFNYGGGSRNRTGVNGFAGRCITTLPSRHYLLIVKIKLSEENSTALIKIWSGKRDSNSRPQPWQGCALPTELFPHLTFQTPVLLR